MKTLNGGTLHKWIVFLLEGIGCQMKIPAAGVGQCLRVVGPQGHKRLKNNNEKDTVDNVYSFQPELDHRTPLGYHIL